MEGRLKISPLDIRTQEFKKSFRGYDPVEVKAFLELIAGEWEFLIKEFAEYKEKMNKLESSVTDFQEMEQTLKGILLTAQRSSEEAKKNAAKEAELLVKDAEVKSSRILEEAKRRIFELRREIEDLSNLKESFLIKMKSMLDTQQYLLESFLAEEKKEPELTRFKEKRICPKKKWKKSQKNMKKNRE